MSQHVPEIIPALLRDLARGISVVVGASNRGPRRRAITDALRQAIADILESGARVIRKTETPSRDGVLRFLGNQVLINTIAWTAGLIAAGLVKNFFEVRGFRNLWGLATPKGRSLVSAEDYELIVSVASYSSGLVMLILVRYLIMRVIAEFHALRRERATADDTAVPTSSDRQGFDEPSKPAED